MTITALRQLLADIDRQGGPEAARDNRLDIPKPADESTQVRAWAAQAGVDCPRTGRPPRRVWVAWQSARDAP